MNDSDKTSGGLSYATLQKAFIEQSLFENKTWRYSPAFALTAQQVSEIQIIGTACYDFYRAQEVLYLALQKIKTFCVIVSYVRHGLRSI